MGLDTICSRNQFLFVLSTAVGVNSLRLVELSSPSHDIHLTLADRHTDREILLIGVPVEEIDDDRRSEHADHEWLFECGHDCDLLLDSTSVLPEHCFFQSVSESVGFAVLKGPLTCASEGRMFLDVGTAGARKRTRLSSSVSERSGSSSWSTSDGGTRPPTASPTPKPTKSPTESGRRRRRSTPQPTASPTPNPTTSPTLQPTLGGNIDVSAIGDPHIQSVVGVKYDLWRTGWSKFLQIPMHTSVEAPQLLVRGKVEAFWGGKCAPAYLRQVMVTGERLGNRSIFIQSGSLESTTPFAVQVDGGPLSPIGPQGTTFLNDAGVQVRGVISAPEPDLWGPDAQVFLTVGGITVEVRQHTEGRYEKSKSMLDLSVQGLDGEVDSVGGWLGTDDLSVHAGSPPDGCAEGTAFLEEPIEVAKPRRHGVSHHSFHSR